MESADGLRPWRVAARAHWPATLAVEDPLDDAGLEVEAELAADRRGDRAEAPAIGAQRLHCAQRLARARFLIAETA